MSIKKIYRAVSDAVTTVGAIALATAWCVTFISLTFALAIWSCKWLFSLI